MTRSQEKPLLAAQTLSLRHHRDDPRPPHTDAQHSGQPEYGTMMAVTWLPWPRGWRTTGGGVDEVGVLMGGMRRADHAGTHVCPQQSGNEAAPERS